MKKRAVHTLDASLCLRMRELMSSPIAQVMGQGMLPLSRVKLIPIISHERSRALSRGSSEAGCSPQHGPSNMLSNSTFKQSNLFRKKAKRVLQLAIDGQNSPHATSKAKCSQIPSEKLVPLVCNVYFKLHFNRYRQLWWILLEKLRILLRSIVSYKITKDCIIYFSEFKKILSSGP